VRDIQHAKIVNAYGGRKSALYAMMHSVEDRPATGSASKVARGDRNQRLAQLFKFAGKLFCERATQSALHLIDLQETCGWIAAWRDGCGTTLGGLSTRDRRKQHK
jgi:hypothetical protein